MIHRPVRSLIESVALAGAVLLPGCHGAEMLEIGHHTDAGSRIQARTAPGPHQETPFVPRRDVPPPPSDLIDVPTTVVVVHEALIRSPSIDSQSNVILRVRSGAVIPNRPGVNRVKYWYPAAFPPCEFRVGGSVILRFGPDGDYCAITCDQDPETHTINSSR